METNHPKDILTLDEFLKLRQEVVSAASATPAPDGAEDEDAAPPGVDEGPPGVDDTPPGIDSNKVSPFWLEVIFVDNILAHRLLRVTRLALHRSHEHITMLVTCL